MGNIFDGIVERPSSRTKSRGMGKSSKSKVETKKPSKKEDPNDPLNLKEGLPKNAVLTGTQEAIELRRRHVKKLMGLGYGPTLVAQGLGVARATISKDFAVLREEASRGSRRGHDEENISDHMMALQAIESSAMEDYRNSDPDASDRNSLLQTALRARAAQVKLQIDSGIIEKSADKLITETDIKSIENMDSSELAAKLKEITSKLSGKVDQND